MTRVGLIAPLPPSLGGATPGGVATHSAHLAESLAALGVDVRVLATNVETARADAAAFGVEPMCRPSGILDWADPRYLSAVGPGAMAAYLTRLAVDPPTEAVGSRETALADLLWYRRFIASARPTVLHVQHPLERHLYARFVRDWERWRIPLVVTLHSFFDEHPGALIEGLMRPNLRHGDAFIAVSRSTAEQAFELGADPSKVHVIRSGVDAQRFQPRDRDGARRRLGLDPSIPVILFVGNLEPRKAVDRLIHAVAHLREAYPSVVLAVIGTGESAGADDQSPLLHRLADDLDLKTQVRFLGRVDESDLLDWYAAADVFGLPSTSEAQGIVALEAMASGLPVVASRVGGLVDTIVDGESGYLVPNGDVEALTARIRTLLGDADLRRRLGLAAREAVVREFSWRRTAERTLDVYREVEEGSELRQTLRRVVAIALGETQEKAMEIAAERFPGAEVTWIDRQDMRRRPLSVVARLEGTQFDDALVSLPDLAHRRSRVTSLLVALLSARRRWIADATGRVRPFSLLEHLRGSGVEVARHLMAVGLATCLGPLALRVLDAALALEARLGLRRLAPGRPRRVLYLRSQFWFGLSGGGSVGHTAGVIGGLAQHGVDVNVVSSDGLSGVEAPVEVIAPERWFDGRLKEAEEVAFNGPFLFRALHAARRLRPDAIYQRYTALNVVGVLLSRLLRIPLILEFNSSDAWKGRHWGEFHQLGLVERGEQVNLRGADRIVVVSRVLRDSLVEAGVPSAKIVVNPNAVDPRRFGPSVDGTSIRERYGLAGCSVVGFSGTFGQWHGIPTLAAALPLILQRCPEARVLLIGDGSLRPLVERTVEEHRLQNSVRFAGLVPYEQMPAYLAACDVLLSPHGRQTDGGEFFGSPTKLYEYMAAGRAIVASGVGQIGEVLRDGENAFVIEPEDPESLADAVVRLLENPDLRARLGQAAREQAEREHTWRQNAERVLASLERDVVA